MTSLGTDGALEFARFAFPPNHLGLCGPDDSAELLELAAEQASGAVADRHATPAASSRPAESPGDRTPVRAVGTSTADAARLRQLAGGFDGAWPYLQVIAAANRLPDPLDPRVVRAYWIGNRLLDAVGPALGDDLDERFRRRAARHWPALTAALEQGARPHHNFHVLCVYPWVGLLRSGAADQALRVADRCRIRWGRVEAVTADTAVVTCQPLAWDGRSLELAAPALEQVTWQHRGYHLIPPPQAGDAVALHWDWLVRPIDADELRMLRAETVRHLAIANRGLAAAPLPR